MLFVWYSTKNRPFPMPFTAQLHRRVHHITLGRILLKNTSRCCIIPCLEPLREKNPSIQNEEAKESRQSHPFFVESQSISRRRKAGRCTAAVFVTPSSLSRSDTASTALGIEGGREGGHRHRPPPVLRSGAEGRHFSSIFPPPPSLLYTAGLSRREPPA